MKKVNQKEFNETIKSGAVLVDFSAEWCGPCKMIAPVLEQLSKEYEGKVKIITVDVDEENDLAMKLSIMSIPTLMLFKNGENVGQVVGFQSKPMLEKFIQRAL